MKNFIENIDVENKRVLVRVDFNVPVEDKKVVNDKKIVEALRTIKYLINKNAKVILCSHLGRPDGKIDLQYSLKPVAKRLQELLKKKVLFASDVVGKDAKAKLKELQNGQVLLLENLRFEKGETQNDEKFAEKLSKFGDIFVNDAFGTAHRAHASTVGVTKFLPSAVGYLMNKEIEILGDCLNNPERPFVAILGGSKVSDKIALVENLINKVNTIIIGGAMAFTFIKALGGNVGKSIIDCDKIELANKLIVKAEKRGVNFLLPIDCVCAKENSKTAKTETYSSFNIPEDYCGFDIGRESVKLFKKALKGAKTVFWNGPMGAFENSKFEKGTKKLAKIVAKLKGKTIIGGGDSANAIYRFKLENKMTHISTGGGASLEFLEGKTLPGVDVIEKKGK